MRLALNFFRVDPTRGGAETYIVDLCRRLIQAGHQVDLYAHEWPAAGLPAEVRCVKVEAKGLTKGGRLWSFARHSEELLRNAPYDCSVGFINTWHHDVIIPQGGVHGASLDCNAKRFPAGWRRAAYRWGKRANPKFWTYRAMERRQYDPARRARVVAVSDMVRGHLERYNGVPPERVRVIPNAIDADRLTVPDPASVRRSFRREHGLEDSDLVGLFLAHNFWLKGLRPLLLALEGRARRDPGARPIHLLVCGGGKIGPFRRLVERLGLANTVHLLGFQDDIRPGFHASDFFVLPSYYDPCSLVVFEALSCGLPVITTRCNGAGELITSGREGFVISEPDDLDGLTDALDRLADDEARRSMSGHAAQLGRAQSFDRHVARLVELFEEVAREKAGGLSSPHTSLRGKGITA